ncbi:MAG: lamin tail domain-containing protein [Patescibacteria group bacterium]
MIRKFVSSLCCLTLAINLFIGPLSVLAQEGQIQENGRYTIEAPLIGVIYNYPADKRVSLTFTKLPEETKTVSIIEQSAPPAIDNPGSLDYEVISTMPNGSFSFDLTLPTNDPNKKVLASDDGANYELIGNAIQSTQDTITVKEITHLTHFIVGDPDNYKHPVINEYFSGGSKEWVEVYNPTDQEFNITAWSIDDDKPGKPFIFPDKSAVPAKGFLAVDITVVLKDKGDTVNLIDNKAQVVDAHTYSDDPDKSSIGRSIDGGPIWITFVNPTKGVSNGGTLPDTFFVDDDWTSSENDGDHIWGFDAFSSIQDAVDFASASATINVAVGQYSENLSIKKEVKLIGTGAGKTIVFNKNCSDAVVMIGANKVTIRNFTFDGKECNHQVIKIDAGKAVVIEKNEIINGSIGIDVYNAMGSKADKNLIKNKVGVQNNDVVNVFDARFNFWGDATGPFHEKLNPKGKGNNVSSNVLFSPFYANQSLEILDTLKIGSDNIASFVENGVFDIPKDEKGENLVRLLTVMQKINFATFENGKENNVQLPEGTIIERTDNEKFDWNNLSVGVVATNILTGISTNEVIEGALQWGIPNVELEFSQPITINIFVGDDLNGQTLNVVRSTTGSGGWTSNGIVLPATCVVSLGLCTFQATKASYFATTANAPTPTPSSSSSTSSSDSGSSNSTNVAKAPACNEAKPGSAPTFLLAKAGVNRITLNWTKALDPVTYYLVAYGTSSGFYQFGNPDIGGRDITSYTVYDLSGGTRYYFRVRAGNGCAPGDFSNELSAIPAGLTRTFSANSSVSKALGVVSAEILQEEPIVALPKSQAYSWQENIFSPIVNLFGTIFSFFGKLFDFGKNLKF